MTAANSKLATAQSKDNATEIEAAKNELARVTGDRDRRQADADAAGEVVNMRTRALDKANDALDAASEKQDQAVAANSAGTTGSGRFSDGAVGGKLDKEASTAVAEAVQTMVTQVINKDYSLESCMSVITSPSSEIGDDARVFCQELVRTVVLTKTLESEQRASVVAQEIARKKALRLDANLSDIDLIIRCVGTGGALDANKVERIFDAANANGKLSNSRPFVVRAENETQLRSVLSRLSDVRSPMAAVIRTNPALCPN